MNSFASHLCGHGGERGRKLGGEAATVGCERSAFEALPLKGSEEKARSEKGQQQHRAAVLYAITLYHLDLSWLLIEPQYVVWGVPQVG